MLSAKNIDLNTLSEEKLLQLRICDLPLSIEGTWLADCVEELYRELELKGIKFKPECYLADEWLTPDKEPVVGIPFFLAHPVLMKLERKVMLEAEGDTKPWCMKLLRHETGHALNYAYRLYRRRRWQTIFGRFDDDYEETYRFRPYSKNFVRHLKDYYAQYHPDEDFAETFAVWLAPEGDWQAQYKGWGAIRKLHYVDSLAQEIKSKPPAVKKGKKYWQVSKMRTTLGHFYKKKRRDYAENFPDFHDDNLHQIFSAGGASQPSLSAAELIRRHRKDILKIVSSWTGERRYVVDDLLKKLIARCRDQRLVVVEHESKALLSISTYVTALVMNYVHTGWFGGSKK